MEGQVSPERGIDGSVIMPSKTHDRVPEITEFYWGLPGLIGL